MVQFCYGLAFKLLDDLSHPSFYPCTKHHFLLHKHGFENIQAYLFNFFFPSPLRSCKMEDSILRGAVVVGGSSYY